MPAAANEKVDFFVSYTGADVAWAEWIAWILESDGYTVIIQAWDFNAGGRFMQQMGDAADLAHRMIAVLSPQYFQSDYAKLEFNAAVVEDPLGESGFLIPVRIEKCDPGRLHRDLVYIDLVGLSRDDARSRLLLKVNGVRTKPENEPPFPGQEVAHVKVTSTAEPSFPGRLPPLFNLPARNHNFTGREALLESLRNSLAESGTAAVTAATRPAAVHGLGGVGKSQLAIEYAWRWASDYSRIIWIRAESPAALAADFESLGDKLKLFNGNKPAEQAAVIESAREHLRDNPGWLLVFDNAEKPKDLEHATPRAGGQVIITSRYTAWGKVAETLRVDVWPPEEAQQFLLKRTASGGVQPTDTDRAAATELAKDLGYLPLALEHAAAYCEQVELSLADYLNLFRENRLALFTPEALGSGAEESETVTVTTTWNLSLNRIRENERCSEAADLFNLCAFFAPDRIPLRIIRDGAEHLPEALAAAVKSDLKTNNALAALLRYSLLSIEGSGNERAISIHRLVQEVTRERLSDAERKQWAGVAACVVNRAFPNDCGDVRVWPICGPLETHAEQAVENSENLGAQPAMAVRLLNELGMYAGARAEYDRARGYYDRALKICEFAFPPDHPIVAILVSNLGELLRERGDLVAAKECFERALKLTEAAFGPAHPESAMRLNNLGEVLRMQGDPGAARLCFERALPIFEQSLGQANLAILINNLGLALEDEGHIKRAKLYFQRALTIHESELGADHPTVAIDVSNLGSLLEKEGDPEGAKACFERALKIWEAALGGSHPNVASAVNNLGEVLRAQGDLKGAKACYERALKIDEAAYGLNHPEVATDVNNLGLVLHAQGDLKDARACYERALRIFRQFLGDDHPNTQTVRRNLESLGGPTAPKST